MANSGAVTPHYARLDGEGLSLVFVLEEGGCADCAYAGARLPDAEDLATLVTLGQRGRHESQPDNPLRPGLAPVITLSRLGQALVVDWSLAEWRLSDQTITLSFRDALCAVEAQIDWRIGAGDVIECQTRLTNCGDEPLSLQQIAALSFPLPRRFTSMTRFAGRWASEMRESRRAIAPDGHFAQSEIGKPGFEGGNWLLLDDPATGEALGTHLAWSGDFVSRIVCDNPSSGDGRAQLQLAARLDMGAIDLRAGASFETPKAVVALAGSRAQMAQSFHTFLREEVLCARQDWGPRKVHCNSWEALGFALSETKLMRLAEDAEAIGAERFVLDDGWFAGRRNDQTSLGDWKVSADLFPRGLDPLISRVQNLGMDFGLWVEPEMISPDSDLYRAHPDWCVHVEGRERPTMRGQLTLDLSLKAVADHLFAQLDALLNAHEIAYLKWDHNRDLQPIEPGGHKQTLALYALLDRLRAAHPDVEIESCASGGGRIDLGIMKRCDRVWPSDNNDPIERVRIMQSWSQFFPLEVLGNHVGPSPNPITGRRADIDFRCKVALFGHMGVEADPGAMSKPERRILAKHIALYKDWRDVLHTGHHWQLSHPDAGVFGQIVVGEDRALAMVAQTAFSPEFDAAPLRLAGLQPDAQYRVNLPQPWPSKASLYLANPQGWHDGITLSGRALMTQGLALPLTHPETAWAIALERLNG